MKRIISILLALALLAVIPFTLASCGDKTDELGEGACSYADTRDVTGHNVKYVEICFEGYGRVILLLDATTAPKTVANFISLVESGFYDGLKMHRIIKDFMIQGGDPKGDGTGGSDNKVEGEFSSNGYTKNDISHLAGVISMARSDDKDSASSQFFICNADASSSLDGNYAAFGYVVQGMSVIEDITEDVFPKTIDSSSIIIVFICVALIILAIVLIVRGIKKSKQAPAEEPKNDEFDDSNYGNYNY